MGCLALKAAPFHWRCIPSISVQSQTTAHMVLHFIALWDLVTPEPAASNLERLAIRWNRRRSKWREVDELTGAPVDTVEVILRHQIINVRQKISPVHAASGRGRCRKSRQRRRFPSRSFRPRPGGQARARAGHYQSAVPINRVFRHAPAPATPPRSHSKVAEARGTRWPSRSR